MIMIEDSLREMFAAKAGSAPSTREVAARAIRRGRVIRRRRAAASSLAVALALVVTVGAVSSLGGWWRTDGERRPGGVAGFHPAPDGDAVPPEAAPAPTPGPENGIGLDLRVRDLLWTSDGRRLRLTGVGEVTRSYRVPTGWVYGGATNIRLLRPDGTSISLPGNDDRWVLSPDGDRIAFVVGTVLHVADLRTTGLAVRGSVDVPPAAEPVAFVGNRVAVSVDSLGFDVLDASGAYPPVWNPDVVAVYDSRDETATGLVRRAGELRTCLAQLRRTGAGLRAEQTGACDLGLDAGDPPGTDAGELPPRLAPGGSWLAAPDGGGMKLVDVARAQRGEPAVVSCAVHSRVAPAWADARTVVAGDGRGVVRCHTDGSQQVVAVPKGVGASWELVPKMVAPADPA